MQKVGFCQRFLRKFNWKSVLIFSILFAIFLSNTFHEEYPDEYDSILGGLYLTQGKLPYRDWFQHHQPFAYLWAAFLLPFAGRSFVRFRILWAISLFVLNVGVFYILKKRFPKINSSFYLLFLFLVAISATYFWGHMLLADTLSSYLIIPALAVVFLKDFYDQEFGIKDLSLFSFFAFLTWFTSMTFTYALAGLYLYAFYLYLKNEYQKKALTKKIFFRALAVLSIPFFLFFLYLVITGSLKEYYFANIVYNQRYYIYNYPRAPGARFNPVRYAVIIASDFLNNFFPLLTGIKDLTFGDPLNITLALSNIAFLALLIFKKKYSLIFPFLVVLIYSNARSNPFAKKESDYQASVYILTSLFFGSLSLFSLKDFLDKEKESFAFKFFGGFLFVFLGVFWFFNSFFLSLKFFQKYYDKYMGKAPLVYDWPQVAPIVNKIADKNEYAWVGPFEFKELFYMSAKVPSKYHWFLQHAVNSDKIRTEMISDFEKNRPKVIVFNRVYTPWGGDARTFNYFFTDFLDKNYFRLFELNKELTDFEYKWKVDNTRDFDIDGDFNFDKNRKEEILALLINSGLIERVEKTQTK